MSFTQPQLQVALVSVVCCGNLHIHRTADSICIFSAEKKAWSSASSGVLCISGSLHVLLHKLGSYTGQRKERTLHFGTHLSMPSKRLAAMLYSHSRAFDPARNVQLFSPFKA